MSFNWAGDNTNLVSVFSPSLYLPASVAILLLETIVIKKTGCLSILALISVPLEQFVAANFGNRGQIVIFTGSIYHPVPIY
jgi:hypothetical protein